MILSGIYDVLRSIYSRMFPDVEAFPTLPSFPGKQYILDMAALLELDHEADERQRNELGIF